MNKFDEETKQFKPKTKFQQLLANFSKFKIEIFYTTLFISYCHWNILNFSPLSLNWFSVLYHSQQIVTGAYLNRPQGREILFVCEPLTKWQVARILSFQLGVQSYLPGFIAEGCHTISFFGFTRFEFFMMTIKLVCQKWFGENVAS